MSVRAVGIDSLEPLMQFKIDHFRSSVFVEQQTYIDNAEISADIARFIASRNAQLNGVNDIEPARRVHARQKKRPKGGRFLCLRSFCAGC